jgi:hypothetical protein
MSNTKSSNFVFVFSSAAITDADAGPPTTRALILLQFLVVDGCRFFVLLPTDCFSTTTFKIKQHHVLVINTKTHCIALLYSIPI